MRKARGDSVLKTLPEERQTEIVRHASTHTLAKTKAWLAAAGVKTSAAALSEFLSWWNLRHQFSHLSPEVLEIIHWRCNEIVRMAERQMAMMVAAFKAQAIPLNGVRPAPVPESKRSRQAIREFLELAGESKESIERYLDGR